jgi:hypothetical protein
MLRAASVAHLPHRLQVQWAEMVALYEAETVHDNTLVPAPPGYA